MLLRLLLLFRLLPTPFFLAVNAVLELFQRTVMP